MVKLKMWFVIVSFNEFGRFVFYTTVITTYLVFV